MVALAGYRPASEARQLAVVGRECAGAPLPLPAPGQVLEEPNGEGGQFLVTFAKLTEASPELKVTAGAAPVEPGHRERDGVSKGQKSSPRLALPLRSRAQGAAALGSTASATSRHPPPAASRPRPASRRPLQELHARAQAFLYFFVDGASSIDASDPQWDLYLVLERTRDGVEMVGELAGRGGAAGH